MGSEINLKARIHRHSKVLKNNLQLQRKSKGGKNFMILTIFIWLFLPFYPSFASLIHTPSETEFDRRLVDESSILDSYLWAEGDVSDGGEVFIQSKNSFLQINAALDTDNRDVSGTKEVVEYEVKPWESIGSIADKFNITLNTIYWANNFDAKHIIHPGDTIKVPPVSGLLHTVKSGETLLALASKYKVDSKKIMQQNLLLSPTDLRIGETIIIPGATKPKPKPKPKPKTTTIARNTNNGSWGYSFAGKAQSEYVNATGQYKLVWRKPYSGVWWNCTYYVASYKNVNWRWNANQWMRNARAKWHKTGSNPSIGAIVQFEGRGYNPYYGHVGIVIDVTPTHIIVSDMNYRRLNEVTTRKVPINDRTIQWYIYVD